MLCAVCEWFFFFSFEEILFKILLLSSSQFGGYDCLRFDPLLGRGKPGL